MAEILGNNKPCSSDFLNLYSSDQLSALQSQVDKAQAEVVRLRNDLNHYTERANYCEDQGFFFSCKSNTGKTTNEWRRLRDRADSQWRNAKKALAAAQKAYNDALELNRKEEEGKVIEHQADVEGQKEMVARGKSFGLWAVIILALGFGGVMIYKKVKK